jgi:two-component system cell cycle sensor histidine kinase PleC
LSLIDPVKLASAFMSQVTAEMIERGRSARGEEARQRRVLTFRLREAREKLTSNGEHRAFDTELLRLFAHSRVAATPAMVVLAAIIGMTAVLWVSPATVLCWLALIASVMALQYRFARRFLARGETPVSVGLWRRIFALAETIQGTVWSFIVVLLLNGNDPNARTFVLFVLLLVAAMTAMISSTIPIAVYGGLMPLTIAVITYMRPSGSYDTVLLTVVGAGAQLYFVVLANRLYSTSVDTLSFRAEKDLLIAELEQAKAKAEEAARLAEEASLAKSRFLATMSHELRTPLNAILGFSEVMKGELFGEHHVPAYREYANDIHSSGQHLLMLINEILDLSRVEAGRYELREEAVTLAYVVEECSHLLSLRAKKRGLAVSEAIEQDLPRIWGDERAIRQIVLNLLSNAIKFTPPGGTIVMKVGWTATGGQYFAIRDSGPGIPEAEIATVMSSFGRGSMAQKNAEEGSGLGLPIVKGLVELHGGTFTLKSKVREGTEVIVVFPPERVMNALPHLDPGAPQPARPRQRSKAA